MDSETSRWFLRVLAVPSLHNFTLVVPSRHLLTLLAADLVALIFATVRRAAAARVNVLLVQLVGHDHLDAVFEGDARM